MSDAPRAPSPFRNRLGLVLLQLRDSPPFASLRAVEWGTFCAIAYRWDAQTEAWPCQQTIATTCGFTARSVRNALLGLEQRGILHLRRVPGPHGSTRIYYSPGSVTMRELAALHARLAKHATRAARAQLAEGQAEGGSASAAEQAEGRSASPPVQAERGSGCKRNQDPPNLRNTNIKSLLLNSAERDGEDGEAPPPRPVRPNAPPPPARRVEGQLTPAMMDESLTKLFGPDWRR